MPFYFLNFAEYINIAGIGVVWLALKMKVKLNEGLFSFFFLNK